MLKQRVKLSFKQKSLPRPIIGGQISTGNPIIIIGAVGYPLGITATWLPTQSGTGDPSPTNVRNLSGRQSVTFSREESSETYILNLSRTIYGGELTLDGHGLETVRVYDLPIADVTNEQYPGWYGYSELNDLSSVVGKNLNDLSTLDNWYVASNIFKSNGRYAFGINTKNGQNILFLNKDVFGLTATQWKEQYPDLVVQIAVKCATPIKFTIENGTEMMVIDGDNTILTDADSLNVAYPVLV